MSWRSGDAVVRRAALRVGLWLGLAAAALVLVVIAASVVFALLWFHPADDGASFVVEGKDALKAALLLGAIAVVVAVAIAWFATRRTVRPLAETVRRQREFVAAASHELRTPLAVLDARLQMLQRGNPDEAAKAAYDSLRADAARMTAIVDELVERVDVDPL
ncbi:histidine kinase dimerization/phospho-acceptor domain-containing protein [Gryllotalpicola sp.]|uniref:histidine kinase dimerization/phospho-acceptor domain-containing protein n=1 Tax=Gryllotalpicola sp. TaxID=1932787 RepID=UPI0026027E7A|nr:histidine kinase dimerization/phospho-acceptor domain-containing protein [Gryllotalpicola sp.]